MTIDEFTEKHDVYASCGDGWASILDTLTTAVRILDPDILIHQIKEKFGGLRYYVSTTQNHDAVDMLIDGAESQAWRVCEQCGTQWDEVKTRGPGWLKTLCLPCHERRGKQ